MRSNESYLCEIPHVTVREDERRREQRRVTRSLQYRGTSSKIQTQGPKGHITNKELKFHTGVDGDFKGSKCYQGVGETDSSK